MNKRTLAITAAIALGLSVLIYACSTKINKPETTVDVTEIPVKLTLVTRQQINDPVVASGFISSSTEARLSFKTGGVIAHIYVQEGESVRKGQLLATVNLTEINAMAEQAKQGLDKAQRDFDRAQNLYRDTVASLEQYQNAQTGLNVAKQQYEQVKFNLAYSEIRAVADGKIVRKLMNEGEIASPGMPVFFMNATSANDWVVKVGIADKDWVRIKTGCIARVKIDAYAKDSFKAVVSQMAQAPDPMSGLYQVELRLKPTPKLLATGLFAKAEIEPMEETTFLSAPVDALIEGNGNEAFVFTAHNNKAVKVPVKLAFIKDGNAMIASGLNDGMEVITDGSAYLTDGALIKIIK